LVIPLKSLFFGLFVLALPWGCAPHKISPDSAPIESRFISEADFNLHLQTLPAYRREAVRLDLEERRKAIEEYLRKRLFALAAQESGHPSLDSLRRRLSLLDQMVITQFYQLVFLGQNLGYTRQEIEAFYGQYPEKFRDSSGQRPPVLEILERVSDTLALSRADLDSFYRANAANYSPTSPTLQKKLAENYLLETKQTRSENPTVGLKEKYEVRVFPTFSPPTATEITAFYNQNLESYRSPDAFDLFHIETSTPEALWAQVVATKTLKEFHALAARISENPWTRPLGGHLGPVKRDFCLPYGIG
jgi:hypothetical protein